MQKKSKPIVTFAFSAIFALAGVFSTINPAEAANLTEAKKVEFETSYFNNQVSNKASRMLLEQSPATTANIKDELNALILKSDKVLEKGKPVMDSLRPERANESTEIKSLEKSTFDNKVQQEAVFLLFELSPTSVEKVQGTLVDSLNTAIANTSKAEVMLNRARGLKQLTIVHVNDTHGRVVENQKSSELGLAKLKTFYDYKNAYNNAMLIDAGDTVHGTIFATISEGESVIDVMNLMGYAASTAGNHDFNYGSARLVELNTKANFPIFAANVVNEAGENIIDTHKIIDVDGVKVGLFGLATEETKTKSSPLNTQGLTFVNSVMTAQKEVEELKAQGAEVIVCVSHLGMDAESKEKSTDLALLVNEIDVIIDGHSHTKLDNGLVENGVLIAQTGAHGMNIGEVTLLLDKDGKITSKQASLHPYARMQYLTANTAVLNKINEIEAKNDEVLKVKVGDAAVTLDGIRDDVRTRETNLGNFIADAMIEATGADVAITNGGGIRDQIVAGEITRKDVLTVFPFTNFAVTLEVPGSVIKAALEHGLDQAPNSAGKFPQIGGMRVKYDSSKPAGSRVTEITVNGQAMDMNKTYKLVTNDFLSIGGDGYEMFKDYSRTAEYELVSEIFENAIRKAGTINPAVDGRNEDVNKAKATDKAA